LQIPTWILKTALIYGINGQDGSYLSELLLEKGYEVHGIIRKSSTFNTQRIDHLRGKLHLHYGDVTDALSVVNSIIQIKPDEVYNLSAQSQVKVSFELPNLTAQVDAIGCLNLLEAIRLYHKDCKFYQAGSSEMFGKVLETPQKESTPFNPQSPYAISKVFAHQLLVNYREAYGLFAVNGILFNHESPRRGETFVTRKITKGIADIMKEKLTHLTLGNLNAMRDWGHSKDYVNAIYLMMQNTKPVDYVVATGQMISVKEFLVKAFKYVGIELEFMNSGINEVAFDDITLKTLVKVDAKYYRPTEVDLLLGDSSKIRKELGWMPTYSIDDIITEMMNFDLNE